MSHLHALNSEMPAAWGVTSHPSPVLLASPPPATHLPPQCLSAPLATEEPVQS